MIEGHITETDHLGMRVIASYQDQAGELHLTVTDRATVLVSVQGFGQPTPFHVEVTPGVLGVWNTSGPGNQLDPGLLDFVRQSARNFAIAKLDVLSHSLVGSKVERLAAMERLYAGVRQASAKSLKSHEATCREMVAPIMVDTVMGPLVVTFLSDSVADLAIPSLENPHRAQGYVQFKRDPDMGWTPGAPEMWDINRCIARFDRAPVEMVAQIMQPAVIAAARLKRSAPAPTLRQPMKKADETTNTAVQELAEDIRKLRALLAAEHKEEASRPVDVITSFLPQPPREPRSKYVH